MKLQKAAGDGSSRSGKPTVVAWRSARTWRAMSNDYLQPSEDEVADQVMADAEGGVESSTLDAPEDEPDSAEPD